VVGIALGIVVAAAAATAKPSLYLPPKAVKGGCISRTFDEGEQLGLQCHVLGDRSEALRDW